MDSWGLTPTPAYGQHRDLIHSGLITVQVEDYEIR